MAMSFTTANRAQNPDLIRAVMQQSQLDNQADMQKQNQNKQLFDAGLQISDALPAMGAEAATAAATAGEGGALLGATGAAEAALGAEAATAAGMGPMGWIALAGLAHKLLS